MKKNTYKILIFVLITLIFLLILSFIFKKDKDYDEVKINNYEPLKTIENNYPISKNKTINNIDYLESQTPIGKFGGNLITTIIGEPSTFNPYNTQDATSSEICDLMYDGLLQTDPNTGNVTVKLAKSFEIKKDNMTYIIHLRRGIKWSDGKEITADDVFYTYDTVIFKGFGNGALKDILTIDNKLPTVKKIDKYTVEFKTPVPFAPFLRTLSASILPKHIFEPITNKGNEKFLTYQGVDSNPKNIVTSGAFKLKTYLPSQRIVLERNPNYYLINKENKKLPYLDNWVMLIVSDLNSSELKFESGEIDNIAIQGTLLDRYRELKKQNNFEIYNLGPTTNTTFITFNLNNRKNKQGKYYVETKKQKWLQNKNFRKAIDWAIDRDDLVLNIFSGLALPLHTAEPVSSPFVNKNIAKGHKKDLNYAKKLLLSEGFHYKNNLLYDSDNNLVEFELLTNAGNTQREAAGVSVKQDLEKIGIKVNYKAIEFNSLVNKLVNTLDYDCIIIALTSNVLEPNAGSNVWKSNGASHLFNKRSKNDMKNTDKLLDFEKELDKLFTLGAMELNIEKRKIIYNKYQEIIHNENPMIYLYAPMNIQAIRNKFKNIYATKYGGILHNPQEIYISR